MVQIKYHKSASTKMHKSLVGLSYLTKYIYKVTKFCSFTVFYKKKEIYVTFRLPFLYNRFSGPYLFNFLSSLSERTITFRFYRLVRYYLRFIKSKSESLVDIFWQGFGSVRLEQQQKIKCTVL